MYTIITTGATEYVGCSFFTTDLSLDKIKMRLICEPGFRVHDDIVYLDYGNTKVSVEKWEGEPQREPINFCDFCYNDTGMCQWMHEMLSEPQMTDGSLEQNFKKRGDFKKLCKKYEIFKTKKAKKAKKANNFKVLSSYGFEYREETQPKREIAIVEAPNHISAAKKATKIAKPGSKWAELILRPDECTRLVCFESLDGDGDMTFNSMTECVLVTSK